MRTHPNGTGTGTGTGTVKNQRREQRPGTVTWATWRDQGQVVAAMGRSTTDRSVVPALNLWSTRSGVLTAH